ncbi:hypothetical protein G7059_07995 [Erysipelothrix sp. HDW6A]|uniref:hypothetical protein n=1 Tax=Erysipelothrix sp. HDW6A TaxID=2714928 RepID=UPI00140D44F9|nr:hypothetical protein [Erysipelothrix sp. HDW6A]QIK57783.1 hypothetical protein G7059_07995 [Erysipelothrix sp. HDW6A]
MKIILDDEYYIRAGQGASYELVRDEGKTTLVNQKDGSTLDTPIVTVLAYNDVPMLVDSYINRNIIDSKRVFTLKEYVNEYKLMRMEVLKLLDDINGVRTQTDK